MKKLISMTDFVLEDNGNILNMQYADFLKQPNEKWMFVPYDENGNVLEEPKLFKSGDCEEQNKTITDIRFKQYQQAKERCLFKIYSFEEECDDFWYFSIDELTLIGIDKAGTIESLVTLNLQLTQTAIKQIGL